MAFKLHRFLSGVGHTLVPLQAYPAEKFDRED